MCACGCMQGNKTIYGYTYKKSVIIVRLKGYLEVQNGRESHLIFLIMSFTVCLFNTYTLLFLR